ncbi:hypothetical protein PYW07_006916 [Mythimna separata]|uniref:Uncharacterized protein n=1 Tax=Mythimna separata TaxID=271217 RepID=A0AAD8E113_MYTSE|nr:hypothetical protein PYW07_006916 [Mythimna separata]
MVLWTICHYLEQGSASLNMVSLSVVMFAVLIVSCVAAPGERVRRHGYDFGHGGFGGGYGGYGGQGVGHGHGHGYGGPVVPASQSFSKSSASASSSSGSLGG